MAAIKCFCPEATLVGFAGGLKLVGRLYPKGQRLKSLNVSYRKESE